jgi:hypothetical protein
MRNNRSIWLSVLPFLAIIVSSLPLLTLEFPKGHDWVFELVRVSEFKSAIINGQFPPYWGENLYGGYGSPIFLYYAPTYSLIATFFSFITGSITSGSTLALIILSMIAVVSMKLLVRAAAGDKALEGEAASRIAAYFFILNPYLICDMLLRNANAEYTALCLSPLTFYGLLLIDRKPRLGGLILSAGFALVITSHNLTALIIFPMILISSLFLYLPKIKKSIWITIFGSISLGLGISAFFWLPALYYKSFVNIEQMMSGKFNYLNQFQSFISLFGYNDFFAIGLLTPLVLLCSIVVIFIARHRNKLIYIRLYIFSICSSLFLIFLQTRASQYFWGIIPYMRHFQFPWRMMGPLALVTSVAAGLSFDFFCKDTPKKNIIMREILILLICIANAMGHIKSSEQVPDNISYMFTGEIIKNRGLPATVLDEYLPQGASHDIWRIGRSNMGPVVKSIPDIEINILKNSGTHIVLESISQTPVKLQMARWFFLDWKCTVNGAPYDVKKNKFGSFDISIPAGFNKIILHLLPPLLRRVCIWVSLMSIMTWCIVLLLSILKYYRIKLQIDTSPINDDELAPWWR